MHAFRRAFGVAGLAALLAALPATAWYGDGHMKATRAAVEALGDRLPEFFRAGVGSLLDAVQDPDVVRLRSLPELRDAEGPEHFCDLELLGGEPLPALRSEFLALCAKKGVNPATVGTVPYAVTEWTQRLTVAFAQHRKFPEDPHIRARCLVYAGLLAHYAQDLCQPLHATVHYDGRVGPDGRSPRSGIHGRMDALLGKAAAPAGLVRPEQVRRLTPLGEAVRAEFLRAHALVERVYEIEKDLPEEGAALAPEGPAAALAAERLRACAEFTASLYLTAWLDSESIQLPEWYGK